MITLSLHIACVSFTMIRFSTNTNSYSLANSSAQSSSSLHLDSCPITQNVDSSSLFKSSNAINHNFNDDDNV
ncbi:hypothetical protein DERF_003569 [Dermatophagoides farinae]|uniref:Uncharacterized protein n=1 Tax=Dermatophagoides farinae TaxID=6954 RepID=A0A922IEF7_DERFA|nr:hypothetical protein DERF_003569 [Dermatophagoides farinae]